VICNGRNCYLTGTNELWKFIFAVVTELLTILLVVIELSSKVVTKLTLSVPSKETAGASTTPVIVKVFEVCSRVAELALPLKAPINVDAVKALVSAL
jgi:hypothetical protein